MPDFIVYALIEPDTGCVRYVGLSTRGDERPRTHRRPSAARARTRCGNWLRALRSRGLLPEWVVLQRCETEDALAEAERFWIAHYRTRGVDIVNHMDGGFDGRRPDDAARARMSAAHIKDTCLKGHLYTSESTGRARKTGLRFCKICRAAWMTAHRDYLRQYHRNYYLTRTARKEIANA